MSRIVPLSQDLLPASAWKTTIPIRFGQCDPAGILYTPNFFDIFNWVIEEWFPSSLGLDYHAIIRDQRTGMGYARASTDFFSPVLMNDHLDVHVIVKRVGNSSYMLNLHAMRGGQEVARGEFITVTTSLDTHKAVPIPANLKAAMLAYQTKQGDFAAENAR